MRRFLAKLGFVSVSAPAAAPTSADAAAKEPPAFAFVALAGMPKVAEGKLAAAMREFVGPTAVLVDFEAEGEVVSFRIAGAKVLMTSLSAPIPWGDLEGPAATSWVWPEATAALKTHQAHAIVLLQGAKGSHVERCLLLTKILAGMTKAFDAVGIYWGHGTVVLSSALIQEMARDATAENLPIFAWIDFRVQRTPGGTNVLTTGLDYFSCLEVEIIGSKRPADDAMEFATFIARMQLQGDVFRDGDTVGPDAQTKIKTRHAKSLWRRSAPVLRVEY